MRLVGRDQSVRGRQQGMTKPIENLDSDNHDQALFEPLGQETSAGQVRGCNRPVPLGIIQRSSRRVLALLRWSDSSRQIIRICAAHVGGLIFETAPDRALLACAVANSWSRRVAILAVWSGGPWPAPVLCLGVGLRRRGGCRRPAPSRGRGVPVRGPCGSVHNLVEWHCSRGNGRG
jgi:hypothetical protein